MKTTITLTATLISALALATITEKTKFDWKPVKGNTSEYTTTNMHEIDMGGGPVELSVVWDSVVTVQKVDKKRVTLSSKAGPPSTMLDGVDEPGINVDISDTVEEYGFNGEFFAEDDDNDHGFDFGHYSGFLLPKNAINVGDTYSINGMKATYVGLEKVKKWETYKFTYEFRPKDRVSWTKGTIWLAKDDLTLVKRKSTLYGADFGMGPEDIQNETIRIK